MYNILPVDFRSSFSTSPLRSGETLLTKVKHPLSFDRVGFNAAKFCTTSNGSNGLTSVFGEAKFAGANAVLNNSGSVDSTSLSLKSTNCFDIAALERSKMLSLCLKIVFVDGATFKLPAATSGLNANLFNILKTSVASS